jgi:hypothetical protein
VKDRIRRLEILADIWGKVFLFHPHVVRSNPVLDWEGVLMDALQAVEGVSDMDAFVSVLNETLLGKLGDPFTFAYRNRPTQTGDENWAITSLENGVGLVQVPSAQALKDGGFLSALNEKVRAFDRLLVDLRWVSDAGFGPGLDAFLNFWALDTCAGSARIQRTHEGWNEDGHPYVYRQAWVVETMPPVEMISQPHHSQRRRFPHVPFDSFCAIDLPTIFLVNQTSYLHVHETLSALQKQPHVCVVWERTGCWGIPEAGTFLFEEGIGVHLQMFPSSLRPNRILTQAVASDDLADLVRDVLATKKDWMPLEMPAAMRFAKPAAIMPLNREARLVGLFKLWTVIRYFDPHLDLADLDWDDVLKTAILQVAAAESPSDYDLVLKRNLARLNDSHARVHYPMKVAQKALPITFADKDGCVVIARIEKNLPVRVGDEVLAFDGKPMSECMAEAREVISASTENAFVRDWLRELRLGVPGRSVQLTLCCGPDVREVVLTYDTQDAAETQPVVGGGFLPPVWQHVKILDDQLGYMTPFTIDSGIVLDQAFGVLNETRGLILDLRGYPKTHFKWRFTQRLCDYLVVSPRYDIPVVGDPDLEKRTWKVIQHRVCPEGMCYTKPVVALIDVSVQSSAEDFCMYLKSANRVTFVGTETAGCQGNAAFVHLPGGCWAAFTGMRVCHPNGQSVQNKGLIPDVAVTWSLADMANGDDPILKAGIETLKTMLRQDELLKP